MLSALFYVFVYAIYIYIRVEVCVISEPLSEINYDETGYVLASCCHQFWHLQ